MRALLALLLAAVVLALAACGASTTEVPRCKPHASGCRETSNDSWIPLAFWIVLLNQQHLSAAATPSYQASVPQSVAPSSTGVSESELEPDESSAGDDESDSEDQDSESEDEDSGSDDDSFDDSDSDP